MGGKRRTPAADPSWAEGAIQIRRYPSLTEQAYQLIRTGIVTRQLRAGDRLVERALAEKFGLSKTPIREAIARLERDGLVVIVPSQGAVVRRLEFHEVRDLLEMRQVLESLAARRAAQRVDDASLEELEQILQEGEKKRLAGDAMAYRDEDLRFHARIRQIAGNATLSQVMEGLEAQVRLVMSTSTALPGRVESSVNEHRRLLAALRRRDPDAAAEAAAEHIARALEAVEAHWPAIERGEF